jgi:hypothetical protein
MKVQAETLNTLKFQDVPLYAIIAVCNKGETVLGMKIDDNLMAWKNNEGYYADSDVYHVDSDEVVTLINLTVADTKCTPPVLISGMDFSNEVA